MGRMAWRAAFVGLVMVCGKKASQRQIHSSSWDSRLLLTPSYQKSNWMVMSNIGENNIDVKRSLKMSLDGGTGYFFVELPEGTILAHSLAAGQKLPMQFGREVLTSLLGKTERSDWKDCLLSKEEEAAMAEDFKKRFEMFDPMQST